MSDAARTLSTNRWFDEFEIDLDAGVLYKRGRRIRLREKCFQALATLLSHPGRVVMREELRQRLWPEDVFVDFENNLNSTIGRLREALGDSAEHPRFIETLPKRGYRFVGTVSREPLSPRRLSARERRRWHPAAGLEVPGTQWVVEEKLGEGGFGEVWLGRHRRLKEARVFKFCLREDRVGALKREMTLFRIWRSRAGDHPHLVRLLGVSLEQPPYYLEEEYVAGRDLRTWCAARGGIDRIPIELRLNLIAQAADGLAAAHDAGILHRDIKPGNILISCQPSRSEARAHTAADLPSTSDGEAVDQRTQWAEYGSPMAKLTDFGVGHLMSAEALAGITATGLTTKQGTGASAVPGTHAYLAPEVLMGHPATVQSDLYSLGVVLYQLLIAEFAQPVTTDWARAIDDVVLQEDLQRCFAGRPAERFASARELAASVRSIPERRKTRSAAARTAFERGSVKVASLAVLPFANLSAEADNEFLSDGIAEDLRTALARVPGLRVPGRTSCFAFKEKTQDLREIGRALGVETVLEGSVQRSNERLRIAVRLINVADGFHLWSQRYDREMADVFAVQDEITRAITAALMPRLAVGPARRQSNPYSGSVDVYELCLQARYHHQKRTPAEMATALQLFEQAVARDPSCALAHAGIAHVCLQLCYFGGMATRDGMTRMKAAASRALELDETLAVTHVRMADALCFKDWNWAGAEREFLRALELDPESAEALWRYGVFLWSRLRNEEALARLQTALELDPFSLDANWFLGWVHLALGRLDDAEGVARRMLAMDSRSWIGFQLLAWIESVRHRWPEAVRAYEASAAIEGGPASLSVLCWVYERAGRPAQARRTLHRLERLRAKRIVPPTWLALAYDGVGAHAKARSCMERAVDERHMLLVHLRAFLPIGWLSSYTSLLDEHGL